MLLANLASHQCGLPKKMALELFKPFILVTLEAQGLATTIKRLRKWLSVKRPEVWDILAEVIRAPSPVEPCANTSPFGYPSV